MDYDDEELMEVLESCVMGDGNAPTRCLEGCEVEPDGTCPHGYDSILLEMGLI